MDRSCNRETKFERRDNAYDNRATPRQYCQRLCLYGVTGLQ